MKDIPRRDCEFVASFRWQTLAPYNWAFVAHGVGDWLSDGMYRKAYDEKRKVRVAMEKEERYTAR